MDEEGKLPLKRVELSLSKFNEVAIPHHLDLLRQHKANILKYEETGDYSRVRCEQVHARRVSSQLRALLGEMEALRRQVCCADRARFDKLTQHSRDLTLKAIMDYLGVIERSCIAIVESNQTRASACETSPLSVNRTSASAMDDAVESSSLASTDSVGIVPEQVQLRVEPDASMSLREREAVLAGWSALQSEVRALHEAWQSVQAAALRQRRPVEAAAVGVEVTADATSDARTHLALAERLRACMYGAGGAVAGAVIFGPAGLLLGAKAGAAALVAGSAVGYLAAGVLGRRRRAQIDERPPDKCQ
ncbi:uncharacterized protein LOC123720575 isoform X1 [Pieris brassicae]|uniref:uncharacterized protein LOC123720575 isoform X1 n=2 Tax=Pieris brassicae TaxID=7116 RepID=UPI001E660D5D|nr:uncharacterized protein LOC123720575 isoform X1 [Pieris brassicae]